jgi:hypothetical protein
LQAWLAGEAVQVSPFHVSLLAWIVDLPQIDLCAKNMPAIDITCTAGRLLHPFLPEYMSHIQYDRYKLQLAIRATDDHGHRQSGNTWERPPKKSLFWIMRVGEQQEDGSPTGQGMSLEPRILTHQASLQAGGEVAGRAVLEDGKWTPLMRCGGEAAIFSRETALEWDSDGLVWSRRGQGDMVDNSYEFRWGAFEAWVKLVSTVSKGFPTRLTRERFCSARKAKEMMGRSMTERVTYKRGPAATRHYSRLYMPIS